MATYLADFSALSARGDRVLSLVYEEFCLLEDRGERPNVEQFWRRYGQWRDSLAMQLRYHDALSQVVGSSPPPTPFPALGEKFKEFSLRSVIGLGGSARVYLANDDSLGGREVVLKVYPDRGSEASILGRLDHANIVPVLSTPFEPETKLRGLCMPYRAGIPLDELIRRVKPASGPRSAQALWDALSAPTSPQSANATCVSQEPLARRNRRQRPGWDSFPTRGTYSDGVAWIVAMVADALAHAHSRGVQHRDVKPANVILTQREGPQLLDFNLAHDCGTASQAEAALRGGTLPYMAPEQLGAFLEPAQWELVRDNADLYSLGLAFRELLIGQVPELPDATLPLPHAIRDLLARRETFKPGLRQVNSRIPYALESITAHCLENDPARRYASAAELSQDLNRYLARRPLVYAPNPSKRELVTNTARRFRFVLGAVAFSASVYLAIAADRWIHAVELRRPFQAVLEAIDQGKYDEAVAGIEGKRRRVLSSPRSFCSTTRSRSSSTDARTKPPGSSETPGASLVLWRRSWLGQRSTLD